jgi:PTH1 family peptidyl-tRNA hydrolase
MIRLIVGLGNPGPEYEATRHNAGFWFVDEVARRLSAPLAPERSYYGLAARVNVDGRPLWLLEPTTYMNVSGKSVAALARFFKIEPGEILVAHDELDLLPGQVRMKQGGSHAGHNGLKDIQAQLGSADFWRLRLGIGHPGVKAEVIDYVLRKPPAAERTEIEKSIEQACLGLDLLLAGEMERATMKINARPPRPKPPRSEKPEKAEKAEAVGALRAPAPFVASAAGAAAASPRPGDATPGTEGPATGRNPRGESR